MIIEFSENEKTRLDLYLAPYLDITRSKISLFIEKGLILVNKNNVKSSYKLKQGDIIEFDPKELSECLELKPLKPWDYKLDIRYEDDDVIVVNKPKNMLTHPTTYDKEKTLCNALLYHCKDNLSDIEGIERRGIVHRLDKNTSGLIICAKNNEAHLNLSQQIKTKTLKRKYKAIALNEFENSTTDWQTINKPLVHYIKNDVKMRVSDKGLEAITNYRVLEHFLGASLVELELKTGRTHQIRAHLASINHPVFGDNLYGAKGFLKKEFNNLKTVEQLLQSYYISFIHPKNEKRIELELEEKDFSEDFIKVLKFLRSTK